MSRPTSGAHPRSRLSLSAQGKSEAGLSHLEDLVFVDTFTHELPGDPLTDPQDGRRPASAPAVNVVRLSTVSSNNAAAAPTAAGTAAIASPARTPRAVRGAFYSLVTPDTACIHPLLIAFSPSTLAMLGLDKDEARRREFNLYMSGATHLPRARPWSAAYGGHQFGCYAGQLGDGRCVTLGEIITAPTPQFPKSTRYEIQLKGAGLTPYSRFGDGLTTLAAAVREFLAAEFMHSVGVPTTRALAVVATQVPVYRGADPQPQAGAVLSRASSSWIRFGTFELFHYRHDKERVKLLADYVIKYHFQDVLQAEEDEAVEVSLHRRPTLKDPTVAGAPDPGDTTRIQIGASGDAVINQNGSDSVNDDSSHASPEVPDYRLSKTDNEDKPDSENDDDDESNEEEDDVLDELIEKPPVQLNERRGTRRLSFVLQSFPTPDADSSPSQALAEAPIPETVVVDVELNEYARFFQEIIRRTADLVASWQAIGFVHGEMNTVGVFHPQVSFSLPPSRVTKIHRSRSSDRTGRYRFERQPKIALWNLSKLGRTLAELIAPPAPPAAAKNQPTRSLVAAHVVRGEEIVRELLKGFEDSFISTFTRLMCNKLGLREVLPTDLSQLIEPLLQLLADAGADYTNFFRSLCTFDNADATDEMRAPTSLSILLRGISRFYASEDDTREEEDEEGEPERAGTLAASMSGALGVTDREITSNRKSNANELLETDESDQEENQSEEDTPSGETRKGSDSGPSSPRRSSQRQSRSNRSSTSSLRARFSIPEDPGSTESLSQISDEITERWTEWAERYRERLALEPPDAAPQRLITMRQANPKCIPRQHKLNALTRQLISRVPDPTGQPMRRSGMQTMDPEMERVVRILIQGEGDGSEEDIQCLREWSEEPPDTLFRPDDIPV
ncbi:hypothetical protein HDU86_008510 [Geranomyces michiganensis]|nr:hypothetical protein HDU86_008510 [Geranomyces michiganensis]